jgi:hypothetical protein
MKHPCPLDFLEDLEHVGESLPGWIKPGTGDLHPRLTLILDTEARGDFATLSDSTLGKLVRLGALQAAVPHFPWKAVIAGIAERDFEPKSAKRRLHALARRFCARH